MTLQFRSQLITITMESMIKRFPVYDAPVPLSVNNNNK